MKYEKCIGCEEKIRAGSHDEDGKKYPDDAAWIADYRHEDGRPFCDGCAEVDREHAATIVKYNGGREVFKLGYYIAEGEDDPEDILEMFNRPRWIDTDGWRGYYTIEPVEGANLIKLTDGWITGWRDDTVSHKKPTEDLYKILEDAAGTGELPFTLYWVFCPTSNVFSTSSELYVPADNIDAAKKWLKDKLGLSMEELERAFS